jgi:hypothetical protein
VWLIGLGIINHIYKEETEMFAKKQGMSIVFLAVLTATLLASTSFAAEEPGGDAVELQGLVSVERDVDDAITSVQLITDEEVYNVMLDAKGLELGEQMEDSQVEVEGVVSEQDDQKWVKVLSFRVVEMEE